jgi:hypothetical protein
MKDKYYRITQKNGDVFYEWLTDSLVAMYKTFGWTVEEVDYQTKELV